MIKLPINIDYSGKVVVVTGAGGLICGAIARAFAQSGAKVAALDLNEDAVTKLAEALCAEGFVCRGYKANVLDPDMLEITAKGVIEPKKDEENTEMEGVSADGGTLSPYVDENGDSFDKGFMENI